MAEEIVLKQFEVEKAAHFLQRKYPNAKVKPVELLVACRQLNKGFQATVDYLTKQEEQEHEAADASDESEAVPIAEG